MPTETKTMATFAARGAGAGAGAGSSHIGTERLWTASIGALFQCDRRQTLEDDSAKILALPVIYR
jgi:hypothetical protein